MNKYIYIYKIPILVGPMHSHRCQRLCCSPAGIEMLQGRKIKIKKKLFFQVQRNSRQTELEMF
jgi:hypothetical protein